MCTYLIPKLIYIFDKWIVSLNIIVYFYLANFYLWIIFFQFKHSHVPIFWKSVGLFLNSWISHFTFLWFHGQTDHQKIAFSVFKHLVLVNYAPHSLLLLLLLSLLMLECHCKLNMKWVTGLNLWNREPRKTHISRSNAFPG